MLTRPPFRFQRRATVLVMVVGVLAMLFIIGSTLLIVSRFERQTAETKQEGRNFKAVGTSILEPIINQLREGAVGLDGIPYNRGWATGETSVFEDTQDFPGFDDPYLPRLDSVLTPPELTERNKRRVRNGDLLTGSVEPYWDLATSRWRWFATSWTADAWAATVAAPSVSPFEAGLTAGPQNDADGDGIRDFNPNETVIGTLTAMFGGTYPMFLRVVPHGGMVQLNQYTHPALLAQVLHPADLSGITTDTQLRNLVKTLNVDSDPNEGRLRRRGMLPEDYAENHTDPARKLSALPPNDMRRKLPVTLGNKAPSGAPLWFSSLTPHWWPADADLTADDANWWWMRLTPGSGVTVTAPGVAGKAKTETGYDPSRDLYDRRHLITTTNFDDILRPDREEESRLKQFVDAGGLWPFYNAINAIPGSLPPVAPYGYDGTSLVFNVPGLRTQFSLRDVLVDPGTNPAYDINGAQLSYGVEASYAKALQLTAYYLAMIQHTTVAPTNLNEQLRTAAQLAVNTIDFADSDSVPTNFHWTSGDGTISVNVYGVEKHPYITEAYAMVIIDSAGINAGSRYAVELYNPYDVDLDLTDYAINGVALSTITPQPVVIPRHDHLVFTDQPGPLPLLSAADNAKVLVLGGLELTDIPGAQQKGVDLTCTKVVRLTGAALGPIEQPLAPSTPNLPLLLDRIEPTDTSNSVTLGEIPSQLPPLGQTSAIHTSVQRHKAPHFWHFTLGIQRGFKAGPAEPSTINLTSGAADPEDATVVGPVHSLLSSGDRVQQTDYAEPSAGASSTRSRFQDLAPFPVLVSDKGLSATQGTLAFPTTGSLLLVTRYGSSDVQPLTDRVTKGWNGGAADDYIAMVKLDNGHLPIFEAINAPEKCTDLDQNPPKTRMNVPWGHLVYQYFTALPLEELTRTLNLTSIGYGNNVTILSLPTDDDYANAYSQVFPGYPLVNRVSGAPSPLGARVSGRININVAPWWVLDGLPLLNESDLPVEELKYQYLDPASATAFANRPGGLFSVRCSDEQGALRTALQSTYSWTPTGTSAPLDLPSISPTMAKSIVGYREKRDLVDGAALTSLPTYPGCLTVGSVADVLTRIPLPEMFTIGGTYHSNISLPALRTADDGAAVLKPYSYLGYSQLVKPLVRLQDWATVKNHVFTIYSTIGTTTTPPVWLRTQVTVDRTRCLYSKDLPAKIAEIPPIGYYNAVNDQ